MHFFTRFYFLNDNDPSCERGLKSCFLEHLLRNLKIKSFGGVRNV